jgi:hypothetical protein
MPFGGLAVGEDDARGCGTSSTTFAELEGPTTGAVVDAVGAPTSVLDAATTVAVGSAGISLTDAPLPAHPIPAIPTAVDAIHAAATARAVFHLLLFDIAP